MRLGTIIYTNAFRKYAVIQPDDGGLPAIARLGNFGCPKLLGETLRRIWVRKVEVSCLPPVGTPVRFKSSAIGDSGFAYASVWCLQAHIETARRQARVGQMSPDEVAELMMPDEMGITGDVRPGVYNVRQDDEYLQDSGWLYEAEETAGWDNGVLMPVPIG